MWFILPSVHEMDKSFSVRFGLEGNIRQYLFKRLVRNFSGSLLMNAGVCNLLFIQQTHFRRCAVYSISLQVVLRYEDVLQAKKRKHFIIPSEFSLHHLQQVIPTKRATERWSYLLVCIHVKQYTVLSLRRGGWGNRPVHWLQIIHDSLIRVIPPSQIVHHFLWRSLITSLVAFQLKYMTLSFKYNWIFFVWGCMKDIGKAFHHPRKQHAEHVEAEEGQYVACHSILH